MEQIKLQGAKKLWDRNEKLDKRKIHDREYRLIVIYKGAD